MQNLNLQCSFLLHIVKQGEDFFVWVNDFADRCIVMNGVNDIGGVLGEVYIHNPRTVEQFLIAVDEIGDIKPIKMGIRDRVKAPETVVRKACPLSALVP